MKPDDDIRPSCECLSEEEICKRLVFSRGFKQLRVKKPGMFYNRWALARFLAGILVFFASICFAIIKAVWG